jgi:predicted transposase YdaD
LSDIKFEDLEAKVHEIIAYNEDIALAYNLYMDFCKEEAERARLMSESKYQMDTQSKIGHARREGRQEGREEGKLEGREEIIELLKSGKSPEEILRDYI